ncbi:DUF2975 domain-containing protein [Chitinophaga parva]|uniref:DUF2975 domain-containing protein n=1 Tax=Chitinophaga parva TaxID=2169414 RepID=A0A2T7BIM2_9BACT|nr:DUF2975 domain-containing protein [Chitinophaga parva]PUZ26135.1 DUF2975 domain-containing protein [Chitinophaga parva]
MKRTALTLLQAVIVLISLVVLAMLIRFPLTEGRAANLDLFSIYTDPFILYGYATSIVFFAALYQAFKLLGYIGRDQTYSSNAVGTLKRIKYCTILLSALMVIAGLYIKIFHHKEDDPAGFLAVCIAVTLVCIAAAATAATFEKKWKHATQMRDTHFL